jgi:D-inositol-3-phosphate glycosyltransferase
VCGNGGRAADAQHFAGELVGRFKIPGRRALPVLALTSDTAFLTAWSNDIGYEKVFSRQVEAHGQAGDVLIGMSTTGLSPNLIEAFNAARELDIACIALIGGDGGELVSLADHAIIVPSSNTQRVQEVHLFIIHALCELVEERFAPEDLSGGARLRRAVETKAKGAWGISHSLPIDFHNTEG